MVLLSQVLASKVYEAHCPEGSNVCIGGKCFEVTFLVTAALNATGVLSATALMLRQWSRRRASAAPVVVRTRIRGSVQS